MTLKETIKFFIPHIRIVKQDAPPKIFAKENKVQNNLALKAANWWENDSYTGMERYKELVWLGQTLFRKPFKLSVTDTYFIPAHDFVEIIDEMQRRGLITLLSEKSKVLEPGCNVGRNLYYLQDKYKCDVAGVDLSKEAVKKANEEIWKGRSKYHFQVLNVLETDFFDQFEPGHFDLVFTRWHLIHIPRSDAKKAYVEKLKRIAKSFVILEPILEGRNEVELYHQGGYALSWDNWPQEYGLTSFSSSATAKLKDGSGTKVFYYNNP